MFWKKILILHFVILLAACTRTTSYQSLSDMPSHWPARIVSSACPNLSGIYSGTAEMITQVGKDFELTWEKRWLTHLSAFVYGYSEFIPPVSYGENFQQQIKEPLIEFALNDDSYSLKSIGGEGLMWVYKDMSQLMSKTRCQNGLYVYPEYTEYGGSEFTSFNERSKRWVGKLEDGSLFVYIQKHKYKKFFLSNPQPEHIFYRFKPYEGEPPI